MLYFFFQAEDGIRDKLVTGVQTCALPISWLMVIAGISLGRPALIAACRAGFCPWPAVSTWPRTTSDTSAASTLARANPSWITRSEEHTSELQSLAYLVCRLLLEKKNITNR